MPITKVTNKTECSMFTSVSSRSASAYKRIGVETAVSQASPHQLVTMLLEGFLQHVGAASAAIGRGDIAAKGEQIGKAIRIIDEGLKPALNLADGGELAGNLYAIYEYSVHRLTYANLRSDAAALADVVGAIAPVLDGWKQIGGQVSAAAK